MSEGFNRENIVQDIKDQKGLHENLQKNDKRLDVDVDGFDFTEFDEAIEKSFQDFLKDNETVIGKYDDKDIIQKRFNNWLDDRCEELNIMENSEIEEKIIKPVSFELVGEATKTQLENLQKELLEEEKVKTENETVIEIDDKKIDIKLYNGVEKQDVVKLFNRCNFKKRDRLLELLATKNRDNVRKFQRILIDMSETDTSKDGNQDTLLGTPGVDGFFGEHTFAAFKAYVENPNNQIDSTPASVQPASTEGGRTEDPASVDGGQVDNSESTASTANNPVSADQVDNSEKRVSASGESVGVEIPVEPKGKPVRFETSSDSQEINPDTVTELTVEQAKDFVEKNKNRETIHLRNLKRIDKYVAAELAKFAGKIYFGALEKVDKDVLNEFANGNCTMVSFPGAILTKENNGVKIIINGTEYAGDNIFDSDVIAKLGKSGVSGSGDAQVPGGSGGSTTATTSQSGGTKKSGNKNGGSTSSTQVNPTISQNNGAVSDGGIVSDGQNESISGGTQVVDVPYDTSMTMSRENYQKKIENTKHEKQAIRILLGLKGFKNQTDDISVGLNGYTIKKLSEERYNLVALKEALLGFQKSKESNYKLMDCFESIFRQYENGSTKFRFEEMNKKGQDGKYFQVTDPYIYTYFDKLGEAYVKYRAGEGGAYFGNVMGLLENYFVRGGISIEDMEKEGFAKIFEENNYGVAKGGVDLNKLNIDFDNSEKSRDQIRYNEKGEKEFMAMLSDFNLDGRLDHNDRGYYMGLELDNLYKSINIDLQNSELSEQVESGKFVWRNIVDFAIDYFDELGEQELANKLRGVDTIDSLNTLLKQKDGENGYTLLKALQNMFRYSTVPVSFILKYGNKEKASSMFLNEMMNDPALDKMYNDEFDKLVEQGLNSELRMGLKPIILGSYINNSFGGGLGVAYDTKNIGSFSLSLGVTKVPGVEEPQVGIVMGWNSKALNLGKGRALNGHVAGGASLQKGFFGMGGLKASKDINHEKLEKSLVSKPENRIVFGPNVGYIAGVGPIVGVSAGIDRNFESGINTQYNSIKTGIKTLLVDMFDDEGFKGFIVDGKIDVKNKREEIKSRLKGKLKEKFSKESNEEELQSATDNLYSALVYLGSGLEINMDDASRSEIAKNRLAHAIADGFANQWRDNAIENLNGKVKLTGASVGLAYVLSMGSFVVTGGVRLSKYGNMYSRETAQSESIYNARLSTGMGMDYLEASTDENGNITKKSIDYLNDKLSIIGNYDIEKMGIRFESLDNEGAKNILYIPRDLIKGGVNMYLDPKLKDFVKSDENGFKIPLNTEIALLTRSKTKSTQFDLIIGNYKKGSDAEKMKYDSTFEGDPLGYSPERQSKMVFDLNTINESLSSLFEKDYFPLSKCEKTTDGNLVFMLKNGQTISTDSGLYDDKGNIVISSYGKLKITKANDGNYTLTFENHNDEKLVVQYDDGIRLNIASGARNQLGEIFESYNELDDIFTDIEKKLSLMDNSEITNGRYAAFMNAAATEDIQDTLDDSDYEAAFSALTDLLNGKLNDPCFGGLRGKLANATNEEKVMIVDRFKAIFSYNDKLVNEHNLGLQLDGRGDEYRNLHGYDKSADFPLSQNVDYRGEIQKQLNAKGTFTREPNPNLIGMTAFYRLGDKNAGRSYMMTELGGTNVLGGETIEITDDLEDTKKWFIANLEKSEAHKEILKNSLSKKLKGILNIENLELSDENLKSLLAGEEVGFNIDNGKKKVKIDVKYVFYLLGECANESIGVELGDIVVDDGSGESGGDVVEIEPVSSNEGVAGIYVGTAEASSRYEIQKVGDISLAFAAGFGEGEKKPDPEPTPTPGSDPNTPDPEPTPTPGSDPNTPTPIPDPRIPRENISVSTGSNYNR